MIQNKKTANTPIISEKYKETNGTPGPKGSAKAQRK
jgi:hypothetical protein